jgi:adenylate cyclase, class 2
MEIERRAKIQNVEQLVEKLKSLSAEKKSTKNQIDKYYGAIELYKKLGYSFVTRIRESKDKKILTVKIAKPKKDGVWEEFEKEIDDAEMFEKMFLTMGLEKIITVEKKRDLYKLGKFTINIDQFKEKGNFVEIELISNNEETKELNDLMLKLGIPAKNIINIGYISLFLKENNSKFAEFVKN